MTVPWNEEMGAIVLRVDNPKALPEGIFSNEGEITFLRGGAFLIVSGKFKKGAHLRALDAMAEALDFGREPLAFHQDPRGVRWARLGDFMDQPSKEIKVPGHGRFQALDVDYETVVAGDGVWVSVEEIYARIAKVKGKSEEELKALGPKRTAQAGRQPEPPARAPDPGEVRNVVVVLDPPEDLPRELRVLGRLADGTTFVVGPKSRGWVDALKDDPGPASLRLIKGPVQIAWLMQHKEFERLDAAMRAMGTPMLIMPG